MTQFVKYYSWINKAKLKFSQGFISLNYFLIVTINREGEVGSISVFAVLHQTST